MIGTLHFTTSDMPFALWVDYSGEAVAAVVNRPNRQKYERSKYEWS
jgi:hypothetical protein